MKQIAPAIMAMSLLGCATQVTPTPEASAVPGSRVMQPELMQPAPESARVIVKRDSAVYGSECYAHLYVDGGKTAELATGEQIELYLRRGRHIVSVKTVRTCGGSIGDSELEVLLTGQGRYTFAISVDSAGFNLQPEAL